MNEVDESTINQLIKLCRIECSEDEKVDLQFHLSKILKYAAELDEIDTTEIEDFPFVLQGLQNVMREDHTEETLQREFFLINAPSHTAGLIRTPPVIQFSNP